MSKFREPPQEIPTFQLVDKRHKCPSKNFIFSTVADVFDYTALKRICYNRLKEHEGKTIGVYITGLVICTVILIEVTTELNIDLIMYFHDRKRKDYIPYDFDLPTR